MSDSHEIFAKTIISLEPYLNDIVLIGGWVHALYLADANTQDSPVLTYDIDFSIPQKLLTEGRRELLDLALEAGFEIDPISELDGASLRLTHPGPDNALIDLDLITEGLTPRAAVQIEGQANLVAQAYPGQKILLENTKVVLAGPEIHDLLSPPRSIRVPVPAAYVLHKALSSGTRVNWLKKAKDLVYLYEIVRHPILGPEVVAGMPGLARQYLTEYRTWRGTLTAVIESPSTRREIAEQLLLSRRAHGSEDDVAQQVAARLRRLLLETPDNQHE